MVVAQRLGIMLNEWDETGGLDTVALAAATKSRSRRRDRWSARSRAWDSTVA